MVSRRDFCTRMLCTGLFGFVFGDAARLEELIEPMPSPKEQTKFLVEYVISNGKPSVSGEGLVSYVDKIIPGKSNDGSGLFFLSKQQKLGVPVFYAEHLNNEHNRFGFFLKDLKLALADNDLDGLPETYIQGNALPSMSENVSWNKLPAYSRVNIIYKDALAQLYNGVQHQEI